jgi:putative addiction module component (TIGR02574 family)
VVDRNAQALADQLLALPSRDRARIAELLLASLDGYEPGAAAAWDVEIDRRAIELESGEVSSISGDAVFAEMDQRLRK